MIIKTNLADPYQHLIRRSSRIWYRRDGHKPEVIDRANSKKEADYLEHEYRMAFATLPGQHRHGHDKVWAGRKDQEP